MEFPPGDWPCLNTEDFELAVPRNPGRLGIEVMAQARVNGRIIDNFRVALGESRDIHIRRNMSSSEWLDVATLLASRDVSVTADGPPDAEVPDGNIALLAAMDGQPKPLVSASIHWAVCAGIEGRMELVLQTFPSTAAILSGKPAFRR